MSNTVRREGESWYDAARLTPQEVRDKRNWCRPALPEMTANGYFIIRPIAEQIEARTEHLHNEGDTYVQEILSTLEKSNGYAKTSDLADSRRKSQTIQNLLDDRTLSQIGEFVYDPLCLGISTMQEVVRRQNLIPFRQELVRHLELQPGCTASQTALRSQFGSEILSNILEDENFVRFNIHLDNGTPSYWIRLSEANPLEAEQSALDHLKREIEDAQAIEDKKWAVLLPEAGDLIRPNAHDGKSIRTQIIARSYTVKNAAKRLGVRERTLEHAILDKQIPSFTDPEGVRRLPAQAVEQAVADAEYGEKIMGYQVLNSRDISVVAGVSYSTVRRRLQRAGINRVEPHWSEIRGRWNLPDTLTEFYRIRKEKLAERRAIRDAAREEQNQREAEEYRLEQKHRDDLRARLVAAFPTWRHAGRIDQQIYLHIGPPNSGKTHEALDALSQARSGWYLAPLRLLAYEIFDRLNQRGVRCNLLTGEEYIPVDGATITAATVEMFDPMRSGECVVIDEAQLLADPDRGWAWTRAMMEALAPVIHVIGPHTARGLIQQLADAALIPVNIIEHERLAPIQIAEEHWPISELPQRTILVAFSRQMVLQLKAELEKMKRRVSVVYGSLPPEVRRKQADRFRQWRH